jgi:hypothetical protein
MFAYRSELRRIVNPQARQNSCQIFAQSVLGRRRMSFFLGFQEVIWQGTQ